VDGDPLFLNKHPNLKVDLVICTAKKKAEKIDLAFAENKLQSWSVFDCKCLAHLCAVTHKTFLTVDITHLEAVDERRASLEIVLVDRDVQLPADKRLQDRHV
jgi:hypothetical protein